MKLEKLKLTNIPEALSVGRACFPQFADEFDEVCIEALDNDFSNSYVVKDRGRIIGGYFLGNHQLPSEVKGSAPYNNKHGIEGVALFVLPEYRGKDIGRLLRDIPLKMNIDYIWGQHYDELNNLAPWIKFGRKVLDTIDGVHFTVMNIKPITESSSGGTSSGSIATVNAPMGMPPEGQFFGGDPNSSIYGKIKKNRARRKVTEKAKTVLNSKKSFNEPGVLRATDKVKSTGPILGAKPKMPHPLDKKFVGCSIVRDIENRLLREFQDYGTQKAGFMPYYIDNKGVVRGLFAQSSNPAYGGTRFMFAKGHVDAGETPQIAAIREGNEELGLKASNLKMETVKIGWTGKITGMTETSTMSIFIGEVKDPVNFDKPGYETGATKWMTAEQFAAEGRQSHKEIVALCFSKIKTPMREFTENGGARYDNSNLQRLSKVNKIAWDMDATLVDGAASEAVQQFIKDNPLIEHYILTARSDKYLVDSIFHELSRYPAKLTRANFKGVLTSDHEKHIEFQMVRAQRRAGQIKGPLTPIEIYELTIKGKRCHELGIPVLVDDNISRSKMGCDKYGIELIDPLDCI